MDLSFDEEALVGAVRVARVDPKALAGNINVAALIARSQREAESALERAGARKQAADLFCQMIVPEEDEGDEG